MIRELADYERLASEVVATEELVRAALARPHPIAEALLVEEDDEQLGFALFFTTFSTFLARPGLWLEDLFVRPPHRGRGLGRALLVRLAAVAVQRGCGRLEWAALDWNESALGFYRALGARQMSEWITHRVEGDTLAALAGQDGSDRPDSDPPRQR